MARSFPYTLYCCPCTDISKSSESFAHPAEQHQDGDDEDNNERTFNPHAERANFALYPLESLLFCNECHELRCPKCYYEEALSYYCPQCLFETQSNVVKSESNRCTRSCFQCPICIAPLSLSSYQPSEDGRPQPREASSSGARDGPCILSCAYCGWTSLEIGITFDKPVNISGQLAKIKNSGAPQEPTREFGPATRSLRDGGGRSADATETPSTEKSKPQNQFANLASFYKTQIGETTPSGPFGLNHNFGLDSPSQLSRLLNTYGVGSLKKQRGKLPVMREAIDTSEGLRLSSKDAEDDVIEKMRNLGWEGTTSIEQRTKQFNEARFFSEVRPIATKLRSKRAKRCRRCRHNLVKPDEKRQRVRYQIKLVALNFIPRISLKPRDPTTTVTALPRLKAAQFLLTFRNPLFDPVKVTLATPLTTPGSVASKVTILCPQFDIGANTDVWDEALDSTRAETGKTAAESKEQDQAIAGKIWEKGRNWTTVIIEIVPGNPDQPVVTTPTTQEPFAVEDYPPSSHGDRYNLEVPVFVRLEYETDDATVESYAEDSQSKGGGKEKKVARELAYWCTLGVGRIS